MSIRLAVRRLTLVAPGNVYDARFRDGVNVIAGPISTGKSSVLALIDYALGSSNRPTYPEISKCSDVLVEFLVGDERLTVQRSLHSVNRKARLYPGEIEDVLAGAIDGDEMSAVHDQSDTSISREFLRRLGLDNIKVKTAPTQSASDVSTFSLRDLMHFVYVDQDRVDSQKSAFFEQRPPVAIKWRAAFEIVTGLYDDVAAGLSASLKDSQTEASQHRQYLDSVVLFLARSQVPQVAALRESLNALSAERESLDERVNVARESTATRQGEHLELVRRRDALDDQRAQVLSREGELIRTLRQLGKLRVQYARERTQLEFLKESESLVGSLPIVRCPVCLQPIVTPAAGSTEVASCHLCHRAIPETVVGIDVERRLESLKRRVLDLESYISDLETLQAGLLAQKSRLEADILEIDTTIRRLEPAAIFPEMRELMQLEAAISLVESKRRQVREHLLMRERAEAEASSIAAIEVRVRELSKELDDRQRSRPSRDQVVSEMSAQFSDVLSEVLFPDVRGVRIDPRTYAPVVRDQLYGELYSRGAIALAVSGWHLAALRYCLGSHTLFPLLFLIDSPLSNVGHDSEDKDFRDQRIVDAFYRLLVRLHQERGAEFQLLMCDNRPPSSGANLVVLQFTGDSAKGRYGLIADEVPPAARQVDNTQGGDRR